MQFDMDGDGSHSNCEKHTLALAKDKYLSKDGGNWVVVVPCDE